MPTGPIGSGPAKCRRPRPDPRAWNETWSLPCGTGPAPRPISHDETASDKRNPTVNAYGPIYGALEASADYVSVLDPSTHTASRIEVPVRDPDTPFAADRSRPQPSPYWGDELILGQQSYCAQSHDGSEGTALDHLQNPGSRQSRFLQRGVEPSISSAFPSGRGRSPSGDVRSRYPKDDISSTPALELTTCFLPKTTTIHSGPARGRTVVGWLNTKMFDETGDAEKSQGWAPLILDANGNGRQDALGGA